MTLTYLPGISVQAAPVLKPMPLPLQAQVALLGRLMPPHWLPLYMAGTQAQGRTILVPRPLLLQALAGLKMTLFWRGSNALPLRGQRYPISR